jgi:Tol biopolymer transport system component
VDFERGINFSINQIRVALCDQAEKPRYIETLPRVGYRFIGSLVPLDGKPRGTTTSIPIPLTQDADSGTATETGEDTKRRGGLWLWVTASLALLIGVGSMAMRWILPPPTPRVLRYTQITNDGAAKFNELTIGSVRPPIVSDGPRLYFTEQKVNASAVIAQISATGGEIAVIPTTFVNVGVVGISPSGSDLLAYTWMGNEIGIPLWVIPVLGGSPRRVGETTTDATWSADGQKIAYANDHDLRIARSDGTDSQKLVSVMGAPVWPRWSPKGNILRFTVYDPARDSDSLWEVSADGTHLHPLLPGWVNEGAACCGNWTPDGKYFVFQSTRNGRTDLWALREEKDWWRKNSTVPVQLTAGPMSFFLPLPSKDGRKVFVLGVQQRGEVVRYDSKSGHFVPYLGGVSALDLAFSRDGDWVAYVSYPDGNLWRSKLDGSERLQLTFSPMEVDAPRWSPNGEQIVFMGRNPGNAWRIYLVGSEGAGEPQALVAGDNSQTTPDWSADGASLVYGGLPEILSGGLSATAVHVLDLKTQHDSTLPGSEGMYCPRWSPDGRFVSAITLDGFKLMVFNSSAQKWTELTEQVQGCPAWSGDSEYIYFQSFDAKGPAFSRVRILDRMRERFASIDFRRVQGGHELWWNGLTPDDSLLALRDEGTQEIYALDLELP